SHEFGLNRLPEKLSAEDAALDSPTDQGDFRMMNRRTFLGTSAATLLASKLSGALPRGSGFVLTNPDSKEAHRIKTVGVQLYTVRDAIKSDFEGTIAKVAQIGYKEVEFAG